jgi:hypothetical protein
MENSGKKKRGGSFPLSRLGFNKMVDPPGTVIQTPRPTRTLLAR